MLMSIEFYVIAFGYSFFLLKIYNKYDDRLSSNFKEILGFSGLIFGAYCTLVGYLLFIDMLQIYGDSWPETFELTVTTLKALIVLMLVLCLPLMMSVLGLVSFGMSFLIGLGSTRKWVPITYCLTLVCCVGTTLFFDGLFVTDTQVVTREREIAARELEAIDEEQLLNYQKCKSDNNYFDKALEKATEDSVDAKKLATAEFMKTIDLISEIDNETAKRVLMKASDDFDDRVKEIDAIFSDRFDEALMHSNFRDDSCKKIHGISN
jgi:hypothetical protein